MTGKFPPAVNKVPAPNKSPNHVWVGVPVILPDGTEIGGEINVSVASHYVYFQAYGAWRKVSKNRYPAETGSGVDLRSTP